MNCFINADVEQMKIALLNIIINAIEAMDGQAGRLFVAGYAENDSIVLTIEDNGCGMTPEQVGRLFESNYSSKPPGLGIGLANVKILDRHQARCEVSSQPNRGTRFSVYFNRAI